MSGLNEQPNIEICPVCKRRISEYYIQFSSKFCIWWESTYERSKHGTSAIILNDDEVEDDMKGSVFADAVLQRYITYLTCVRCGENLVDGGITEYPTLVMALERDIFLRLTNNDYMTWKQYCELGI
jgi:hypothetical protein